MFCYQPEKTDPYYVAGVFNSRTEHMTEAVFNSLITSPQTQWLVRKLREVKADIKNPKWLEDEDYKQYLRRMESKPKSREGMAFFKLKADENRVAMWAQGLKSRLPFVIFIGTYPNRAVKEGGEEAMWRNQKFIELNGLDVMDFDHVAKEKTVTQMWDDIVEKLSREDRERIVLAFVSPGGDGLKVVFKADPEVGNLIDNQIDFARKFGLELDQSCKDAARGTFLTTAEDILYINTQELFNYDNKVFNEKFASQYHRGNSQPTLPFAADSAAAPAGSGVSDNSAPVAEAQQSDNEGSADTCPLSYKGVPFTKICLELLGGKEPGQGDRHPASLKLASDLRYITDNDPKLIERILRSLKWVDDIVKERGEDVGKTVESAMGYKFYMNTPKRIVEALIRAGVKNDAPEVEDGSAFYDDLPVGEWGERIKKLFGTFPCLKEACHGLGPQAYPAAMFVTGALLGTDMTRTWWYFYHRPDQQRRLNYCIMVIGDPASGKSFATRLYELLAAPIKTADKVGYDAVNRWKAESREKGASKDKPKKPQVIIRDHPARTSNATFIEDMNNAVEIVDGQPMHLHMLTFDSELDNATSTQRGGAWIDKQALELKAFHNEDDGQAYSNLDSISGKFYVYWNFIYTGTPLSLSRKVTERNFGSGLSTRLAVIPMPGTGFKMMELKRVTTVDHTADETLKQWAFRLDDVKGELPLWPLVEHTWYWLYDKMQVADFNQDKADELLMKRVPYYGICVAAPFILMRHWDEWQAKKTFEIDDKDKELCTLVMDIQYATQWKYFGEMARQYFDNMKTKELNSRRRRSRYDICYEQLPQEFTTEDVVKVYGLEPAYAVTTCYRLKKSGHIESIKKGVFRKIKKVIF